MEIQELQLPTDKKARRPGREQTRPGLDIYPCRARSFRLESARLVPRRRIDRED